VASYQTEQRKALLDYLHRHQEAAFSAGEVARGMHLDPGVAVKPATSTVYRLLTRLTQEGLIKRFVREERRQYLYQALACTHEGKHLHLKCQGCDRLIHMDGAWSSRILKEINREMNFLVDEEHTVLYGHCAKCGRGTP